MSSKRQTSIRKVPASSLSPQKLVAAQQRIQQYAGPIPPLSILSGYDQVVPGAAERILLMAEKDAQHTRNLENKALEVARRQQWLGQIFGFGIGIAVLVASMMALVLGYENAAMVLGGTTIVGLVAVFVTGRVIQNKG